MDNKKSDRYVKYLREEAMLDPKSIRFIIEYIKDMAPQRASEAAGYSRDHGYKLLQKESISDALDHIFTDMMNDSIIDADVLLYEMWDNHRIARQKGDLSASNTALSMMAKHKRIDAYAADKVKVSTDADVAEKLSSARERLAKARTTSKAKESDQKKPVSFLNKG